jgi:tRNA A-37 threonylcarbamoyl transferase component Bud32
MEGTDFDDMGIENLSEELKMSAVKSLRRLSQSGLLHNDVALRNIVQSRNDPKRAKILDFGRAEFSDDERLLQKQTEDLKFLLCPPPKSC